MRWPPGWPIGSYGLTSLQAAIVAEHRSLVPEFSRAAFARNFVHGLGLKRLGDMLAVAVEVGLDADAVNSGVAGKDTKNRLTEATEAAIAAGAAGVPTVLVPGQSFSGDDQLAAHAAAISAGDP